MSVTKLNDSKVYKACRNAGMTAKDALERAHYIEDVKAHLAMWDQGDSKFWDRPEAEVWFVETPEGRCEVAYDLDQDTDADALDGYTPELQEAHRDGRWYFWTVSVVFIHKDGRVGESYLGAIDAGDAFKTPVYPLSEPEQIFAVAIEYYGLDREARLEALKQ